jgi:hypothetical protein
MMALPFSETRWSELPRLVIFICGAAPMGATTWMTKILGGKPQSAK